MEERLTKFINLSNRWVGRDNDSYENLTDNLQSIDYFHMAVLIMCRRTIWEESRFTVQEIEDWFGVSRRMALNKIELLKNMQKQGYIKYEMPFKDHIVITYMSNLFYPENNFTQLSKYEIEAIKSLVEAKENKDKQINFKNLMIVYFTLKSYMSKPDLICYPSERTLQSNISKIGIATVNNCLAELKRMKLIYFENRGYDKIRKRNLGNVYTLYDDNAIEKIRNFKKNSLTK